MTSFILWSSLDLNRTLFTLRSSLDLINRFSHEDFGYVIRAALLCGAVEGFILGILQGIVLQTLGFTNLKKVGQWCLATVFSMPVGWALSMSIGLLDSSVDSDYSIVCIVLPWTLTGLLLGAIFGHHRQQKIQFAVSNAVAYTIWGMAQVLFITIFGAVLDHVSAELIEWVFFGLVFTLMLVVGLVINRFVLLRSRLFR